MDVQSEFYEGFITVELFLKPTKTINVFQVTSTFDAALEDILETGRQQCDNHVMHEQIPAYNVKLFLFSISPHIAFVLDEQLSRCLQG